MSEKNSRSSSEIGKVVETGLVTTPSNESEPLPIIDKAVERRALFKMDCVICPIVGYLYLVAYLDRANIGNASTAGMLDDLHLKGTEFNVAVSIFYVTYVCIEIPGAITFKRVPPQYMLACISFGWGMVCCFSGFMKSYAGLIITRLFLGGIEGCLFSALTLYLSGAYRREELGKRMSYLFVACALSGAFGGLLAYGILQMDGLHGMAGWRYLYIIEGCISFLGIPLSLMLPRHLEKAWFLNEEEREVVRIRTMELSKYNGKGHFQWAEVKKALTDWKVYFSSGAQFCVDIVSYGFSTFLPTIISALGYNTLQTQYMTIPVYIVAAVVYATVANLSDRYNHRFLFLLGSVVLPTVGYIGLLATKNDHAKLGFLYLVASCLYIGPGANLSWLNNNIGGQYKRAAAVGFQQTLANCAGIVAGQIYTKKQRPNYYIGHGFSLGSIIVAGILYITQYLYFRYQNNKRDKLVAEGYTDETAFEAGKTRYADGDDALSFRYLL